MARIVRPKKLVVYLQNNKLLMYDMNKEAKDAISAFGYQLDNYKFLTICYDGENGLTEELIFKEDIKRIQLIYEDI